MSPARLTGYKTHTHTDTHTHTHTPITFLYINSEHLQIEI